MSLYNVFNITGTGMSAQSVRLNTTASNLANAQSVASSVNETYKARHPVFSAIFDDAFIREREGVFDTNGGVKVLGVVESDAPYNLQYEPHHPMANEEGYVTYPNVNVVEEMTNMISASRSYQMNVELMNTAKTLAQRVLTLGQ
ncbi:MAG: flagellar basal body rod protein FlgC [Pseudomonadales bacterium]|jgi:flagellar basal-body rod protein FlgC